MTPYDEEISWKEYFFASGVNEIEFSRLQRARRIIIQNVERKNHEKNVKRILFDFPIFNNSTRLKDSLEFSNHFFLLPLFSPPRLWFQKQNRKIKIQVKKSCARYQSSEKWLKSSCFALVNEKLNVALIFEFIGCFFSWCSRGEHRWTVKKIVWAWEHHWKWSSHSKYIIELNFRSRRAQKTTKKQIEWRKVSLKTWHRKWKIMKSMSAVSCQYESREGHRTLDLIVVEFWVNFWENEMK